MDNYMKITKKESKFIRDIALSSLNKYSFYYSGEIESIFISKEENKYYWLNEYEINPINKITSYFIKDALFFRRTTSGAFLVLPNPIENYYIKSYNQNSNIEILYTYLLLAQLYSDLAKNRECINWESIDKTKLQIENDEDRLYESKKINLQKAVMRANEIGIVAVYDKIEQCVYFELSEGQASFHVKEDSFYLKHCCCFDNYEWSGLKNTAEIINSYFK